MEAKQKTTRNCVRCTDQKRRCDEIILVKLPTFLKIKLFAYALENDMSASAVIRSLIKNLPKKSS